MNAGLTHSRTAVPALHCSEVGQEANVACLVHASPSVDLDACELELSVPPAVLSLLEQITIQERS